MAKVRASFASALAAAFFILVAFLTDLLVHWGPWHE